MSNGRMDSSVESSTVNERLGRDGYVFIPRWDEEKDPTTFFTLMEKYVDRRAHAFGRTNSSIQILKPRTAVTSGGNRYSDIYGLEEFPLHTDFAHWSRPPRIMVLRCVVGCLGVSTNLLPASSLDNILDNGLLFQAMYCSNLQRHEYFSSILPMVFSDNSVRGVRWDRHSLKPINKAALNVSKEMSIQASEHAGLAVRCLANRGDTLIIDNWRCLHGRSRVPKDGRHRRIQRVYLSEVHDVWTH